MRSCLLRSIDHCEGFHRLVASPYKNSYVNNDIIFGQSSFDQPRVHMVIIYFLFFWDLFFIVSLLVSLVFRRIKWHTNTKNEQKKNSWLRETKLGSFSFILTPFWPSKRARSVCIHTHTNITHLQACIKYTGEAKKQNKNVSFEPVDIRKWEREREIWTCVFLSYYAISHITLIYTTRKKKKNRAEPEKSVGYAMMMKKKKKKDEPMCHHKFIDLSPLDHF